MHLSHLTHEEIVQEFKEMLILKFYYNYN